MDEQKAIIIVDDEEIVRELLTRVCGRDAFLRTFRLVAVNDLAELKAKLQPGLDGTVALAICDAQQAGFLDFEAAGWLLEQGVPASRIVGISGHGKVKPWADERGVRFFLKPIEDYASFVGVLHQCIKGEEGG